MSEMATGTASRWEVVEVPTVCTLGDLRKALERFGDDCVIQFSADPKMAESMTRIPVRTNIGR